MKALVYYGPRDVRVMNVPDAKIEQPTDVLVKITTTNICGSDLGAVLPWSSRYPVRRNVCMLPAPRQVEPRVR